MEGVVDLLGATEPATETIPLLMSHLTFAFSFIIGFILIFKEAGSFRSMKVCRPTKSDKANM